MPNSKIQRRGQEENKNRRGKLAEKSSSFHGRIPATMATQLRRPKTVPDLHSLRGFPVTLPEEVVQVAIPEEKPRARLTKLLLNVTIRGSVGAVQVIMSPESTVGDLVAAALRQYAKEGRRPILTSTDPSAFGLHYSQFSLESLDREEKLMTLGSRNFFLCPIKSATDGGFIGGGGGGGGVTVPPPSSSCSNEAEKATKSGFQWPKFMDFLL